MRETKATNKIGIFLAFFSFAILGRFNVRRFTISHGERNEKSYEKKLVKF